MGTNEVFTDEQFYLKFHKSLKFGLVKISKNKTINNVTLAGAVYPNLGPHLQTQFENSSRHTFSWPPLIFSFFNFYLPRCTLLDFPSDSSPASLPFLSCCHQTTTTICLNFCRTTTILLSSNRTTTILLSSNRTTTICIQKLLQGRECYLPYLGQ